MDELSVPEGLALLLLHDVDGRRVVEERTFHAILAAATLAELSLSGDVVLTEDGLVVATSGSSRERGRMIDVSELIRTTPVPHIDEWWIEELARPSFTDGILDGLVRRGILVNRRRRFLGLEIPAVFPALRTDEEDRLRVEIRFALATDREAEPRVWATIALLDVVGRLRHVTGFIPDRSIDLHRGQWAAAGLQAWLAATDPVAGGPMRSVIARQD
jgi:hypothetical protein